jgi:hypothetical protein
MSGRLNIPSNRPWKEIRRKKVSNYEILLNALCDPENQPHQWIGVITQKMRTMRGFVRELGVLER